VQAAIANQFALMTLMPTCTDVANALYLYMLYQASSRFHVANTPYDV
jgi:hypothetical protein